jgi:flagellar hook-associated protein 2
MGASTYGNKIETYGDEGIGVLTTGKDAWFSVEDITMNSSSNKATGIVTGVTFELHNTTEEDSVKVSLTRDIDGIKKKFQDLIDSYNSLVRFKKESTKHADPEDEDSDDGDLAGDSTVGSIVNQIKDAFRQQFDIEGSAYTNFTMLGLKTNTQTGEFELDADKFNTAVDTDLDSVIKLFTTSGNSSNGSITLGRTTKDTQAGQYTLKEIDADHFDIQLEGSTEWIRSKTRVGDIITFDQGPAKGLSLTAPKDSVGAGSATFTLMKGISSVIDETIAKLNDSRGGLITMRQESMEKSMDYADERILKLEDKIERYRMRLVKQFSDMEQALNQMQTQSTNMVNSLAYTYNN